VSITSPQELEGLQAAGAVVRRVLEAMKKCVRPGITTGELDAVGALVMRALGARADPAMVRASRRRT
jgi:methionyl aminopeptidase